MPILIRREALFNAGVPIRPMREALLSWHLSSLPVYQISAFDFDFNLNFNLNLNSNGWTSPSVINLKRYWTDKCCCLLSSLRRERQSAVLATVVMFECLPTRLIS